MRQEIKAPLGLLLLAIMSTACTRSALDPGIVDLEPPSGWHRGNLHRGHHVGAVTTDWLASFEEPALINLVAEALAENRQLAQERALLAQAKQAAVLSGADRLPALGLSLAALERGQETSTGASLTEGQADLQVDLSWEVDVWGRLGELQRAARLDFAGQQARVQAREHEIVASTVAAYFDALAARELLEVAVQRLENVRSSREIVAGGYRQGLNEALDLYLARSQVASVQAVVADQDQQLVEANIAFQLLLGRYPDGELTFNGRLPVLNDKVSAGVPSDLLTRRADLQEAWLRLLAADAAVAVAHKNRFPRVTLAATGGFASAEFSQLLNGAHLSWSVLGSLVRPLVQAGRLAALEEQAVAGVRQAEQVYLESVFAAFSQVESALYRAVTLQERYSTSLDAEANADAALTLALEQYRRGLIPFTTVLESQRQAFDAATTVIRLRNELLQNRIALHLALGGRVETNETTG